MHDATDARGDAQRNGENRGAGFGSLAQESERKRRALAARLRALWIARLRQPTVAVGLVKGTATDARRAAASFGLLFLPLATVERSGAAETRGAIKGEPVAVARWLNREAGKPAPFPAGSLLWYRWTEGDR